MRVHPFHFQIAVNMENSFLTLIFQIMMFLNMNVFHIFRRCLFKCDMLSMIMLKLKQRKIDEASVQNLNAKTVYKGNTIIHLPLSICYFVSMRCVCMCVCVYMEFNDE